jgi:hypothetical protein
VENKLIALASDLQAFFEEQGWDFCFIGGLAVQVWGEPRITRDVDASLLTRFAAESAFIDRLLTRYAPRIPDAKEFALSSRVLLLRRDDIGIDIGLAGLPFEEQSVAESELVEFLPGCRLRVISATNLLVMKAFAARDRDWLDVRGILVRQGTKIDRSLVLERLAPLVELKEEPEIIERLERLFRDVPEREFK